MAELIDVANAMFKNKSDWKNISDFDKEKNFFIFNRYFSKKYPVQAQLLNQKSIDKVSGMDIWYYFMINKPYPNWFWSKSIKDIDSDSSLISEKDFIFLQNKLEISKFDLQSLIDLHPDLVKEELKYYKDLDKNANNKSK